MSTLSQFFGGIITGYTQSATLTSSGTISIPAGTKRIEALLCGGGGGSVLAKGGGNGGNGGGGAGGGNNTGSSNANGGNGFAIFRFYY